MDVLTGTAVVMMATASVSICTDTDSYCACLHRILLGVSYKVVSVFSAFDFIFSLFEIILSFIVLIITIFDFSFSDIDSRFFSEKINRNLFLLFVITKTQKRSDIL